MSMVVKIEVAIDLDENRRVWVSGDATPVEPESIAAVASALAENVTAQALAAYQVTKPPPTAAEVVAAAKAKPDMRSFGEENDDDPS